MVLTITHITFNAGLCLTTVVGTGSGNIWEGIYFVLQKAPENDLRLPWVMDCNALWLHVMEENGKAKTRWFAPRTCTDTPEIPNLRSALLLLQPCFFFVLFRVCGLTSSLNTIQHSFIQAERLPQHERLQV
jgi:hypothetical protein